MDSDGQFSIPRDKALSRAVEAVGGWAALARGLGATRGAIWQWRRIPAARVLAVERLTGVSRHDLRPDLYPIERPRRVTKA
jgi:DNA-binding transcriptional regulator YdaS (Cro superfamily)